VKGILQNTAIDMGAPGYDVANGAGYMLADRALSELGNPAPYITGILYDTTLTPGLDTIVLTVYGEYLSEASTVWLDGAPLTNGVVIQGDSAIITLVQPFTGLYPAIQVYNPPMAGTNGTDGGLSNPLYFTTKKTILVDVDDKSKKYGEVLPAFTAQYTLESLDGSVPFASSELTAAEQARIQSIGFSTVANSLSNVGLWGIDANASDPLSPNTSVPAADTLDISLLQRYNIVFRSGVLTIDPADLKITARDTTIVYGQPISDLGFDYELSNGNQGVLNITPSDNLTIVNTVKSTRGTALVNATGLVRGTALVNADGDQLLTDDLLRNFSFMISQAVASTRGTALVNGELIDPEELYFATAITNAESRLVRGTALVNGFGLVRGTALVNTIDTLGAVTNTSSLDNAGSLVNSSGEVNATAITLNSNTQTLVILGDDDIAILSGDAQGEVVLRSVNLITGNTVGAHFILPGTFISNNFNISYDLGQLTILPATAQFTVDPATLTQTYTGGPITVGVTAVPDSVDYIVTYNGSTTPPVNAGTYAVQVTVDDPNYVGSATATLTIQKATAQIAIGALTQVYSTTTRMVNVTVTPSDVPFTVTYNGSATAPVNAGSYAVLVTVNTPNYQGTASATLVVQKAPATATTGIYVINKGQALPTFVATYSGFLGGQTASVVSSTTFTLSPNYNNQAGVYQIIVNATAANYTFTSVNGTLYVNPAGAGTKQVKPNFICYEVLPTPNANGYTHVAWFNYENPNNTAVYIPVGTRNSFSGSQRDASLQPVVFVPGISAPIPFPYMGGALTWQITSNKNNGTTGSIPANTSNVVCTAPGVKILQGDAPQQVRADVRVYPNPSTGKVFVEFTGGDAVASSLEVYSALGARCSVQPVRTADHLLEVDLATLGAGMYIINLVHEGGMSSTRVIIE
jgi:hypothetical protein